jgi:hypothetical protein
MKSTLVLVVVLGIALLLVNSPILAHHGASAYENKITEFKQAMVTKFLWANPHSLIEFDVKDEQGKVVHWTAETASPEALKLIGWSKSSLAPGDVITVFVYAAKTGRPAGRLNKVVLADGSALHDTALGGDEGNKSGYGPGADKYRNSDNEK